MFRKIMLVFVLISPFGVATSGGMADDPLLTKLMIDQLEVRNSNGNSHTAWEADMWIGKDLNKLWIKTEGEIANGETEELEVEVYYSRSIARYWDFQVGFRHDSKPAPQRDWFAIGFKGLAPYYFDIDSTLYIGKDGQTAFRLKGEYELMFTQKLALSVEGETNLYSESEPLLGIGSGLSDLSLGLRLRYHIKPELAPYIGVRWGKKFGETADFARLAGDDTEDTQFVIGIHLWF